MQEFVKYGRHLYLLHNQKLNVLLKNSNILWIL